MKRAQGAVPEGVKRAQGAVPEGTAQGAVIPGIFLRVVIDRKGVTRDPVPANEVTTHL